MRQPFLMKIKIYGSELLKVHLIKSLSSTNHSVTEDAKPDLVLGLNELENSAKLAMDLKVPMATWFTDTHKAKGLFIDAQLDSALALIEVAYNFDPHNAEVRELYGKMLMSKQEFEK
ncbi:MAG: hypothetical protein NE330_00395, partial [Lentisphaeraceae bacterium]|nr:hypothetical protein [Lentisphaeraceae bacterium]